MTDRGRDVAVVTGGASGFGLALGEGCASRGMDVVLLDREIELATVAAAALGERYGVTIEAWGADVGSADDLRRAAANVTEWFGAVDLLFVNVGVQQFGSIETLTDDEWRWVLDVNVVGAARTVRSFLPLLRHSDRPRIAFTSSVNVLAPSARLGAYQASKAALVALAETLRMELEDEGIGVSVLFPAGMMTRHLESSVAARPSELGEAERPDEDLQAMIASRPLRDIDVTTPDVAARHALAEVLADEAYVVTHGDPSDDVRTHHAAIDRAVSRIPKLPDAADQSNATAPAPTGSSGADDVEAIRQLKARYFRFLDTKDWDALRSVFTSDIAMDTTDSGGGVQNGVEAVFEMLVPTLQDAVTVHHGHMPEIRLTSPTTADGVWAMEDLLRFGEGGPELRGWGHYHETYRKVDGDWRIATLRLTRLRLDVS